MEFLFFFWIAANPLFGSFGAGSAAANPLFGTPFGAGLGMLPTSAANSNDRYSMGHQQQQQQQVNVNFNGNNFENDQWNMIEIYFI